MTRDLDADQKLVDDAQRGLWTIGDAFTVYSILSWYIAEVRRLRGEMDEYKQKFDKAYLDQGEALSDVQMELSAANLALSIAADRIAALDADIDAKDIELGDLRDIAMEFEPGEMGEFLSWRDAAKEAIKQKDATIERQAAKLREKDAEIERLKWDLARFKEIASHQPKVLSVNICKMPDWAS